MNKKALFNAVEIMVYVVITVIVAVFIAFVAVDYRNEDISTTQLETFLLQKKLTNSCLAYADSIRTYPSVIDLKKLSSETLSKCYTKEGFGYSIKILELNSTIIKEASNLNLQQKADIKVCERVPGHECFTKKLLINFFDGSLRTGYMEIGVINLVE